MTGGPAIYREFTEITDSETRGAEEKALPIALVVLVIVFGTLVAAATPLLLALVAVPIALAIIYGVALHTTTSVFVLSVASIIGLGISIDYSLFMVRRFRDELRQRESVREAVAWTVATAGEAILFSGLTVIIGFIGLLLIGLQFMTSMGVGGAVVVAVAVLAALTLLPAILSVLGPRVNAIRIPLLARFTMRTSDAENDGDAWLLAWVGAGRDAASGPDRAWSERALAGAGLADHLAQSWHAGWALAPGRIRGAAGLRHPQRSVPWRERLPYPDHRADEPTAPVC